MKIVLARGSRQGACIHRIASGMYVTESPTLSGAALRHLSRHLARWEQKSCLGRPARFVTIDDRLAAVAANFMRFVSDSQPVSQLHLYFSGHRELVWQRDYAGGPRSSRTRRTDEPYPLIMAAAPEWLLCREIRESPLLQSI